MAIEWTKDEIKEFDRLCDATGSRDQVRRIAARLDMDSFISKHGKEKCDAMWAHLESGGKIAASQPKGKDHAA